MSSVLETFFVLFKSDNEELNKGAKEAEQALDNVEKKIDDADKASLKLGDNFGKAIRKSLLWVGAVSGIGQTLASAISVSYVDRIYDSAQAIGVNVESYGAWTSAVEKAGGSAQAFEKTIKGLNEKLFDITAGAKGNLKPFFDSLGISVYNAAGKMRESIDLLPELADKFQNLSESDAQGLAAELGIDSGAMLLLRQGRMAVEEQIKAEKRLGVVRERDAAAADSFKDSAAEFGRIFKVMGSRILHIVLPPLEGLFDALSALASWAANNGRFLAVFFGILSGVLVTMFAPALWGVVTAMGAVALSVIAATWPFLAVGAVIAAVALIVEDLWAYFTGAPSVTGKLISAFQGLPGPIKAALSAITAPMRAFIFLVKEAAGLFGKIGGFVGGFFGNEDAINAKMELSAAANNPLASQSSAAISNSASSSKTNKIDIAEIKIETQATDADGIAKAMDDSLKRQIDQTTNDYDDGVRG